MLRSNNICDCLAIAVLEFLGNKYPEEPQILIIKNLIHTKWFKNFEMFSKTITPQEKACLILAAYGKSKYETSQILKINCAMVKKCWDNMKKKLECKTISQVIFSSICYRYISSQEYKGGHY